jgi:hypothetical protein
MIYPAFILSIITLATGIALAYRNKALNERQARKVHCEGNIAPRRIHHN